MDILCYMTFPDLGSAENVATALVETRLAAGVNISGPVKSIYRWKGQIHIKQEYQIFAQISATDKARMEAKVLELHPYQVPCIIFLKIEGGYPPFLNWIDRRGD